MKGRLKSFFASISRFKREGSKKFRSLTVSLTLAFLGLCIFVLFLTSSLSIFKNYQNSRAIIAEQQQLIAKEAATTVKSFLQENFSILTVASKIGDLEYGANTRHKTVLEKLLGMRPSFRKLALFSADGKEISKVSRTSNKEFAYLTTETKKAILTQVRSGANYIGSIYIDDITFEPMVLMAVPVQNVFGDFKGTIVAEVNLKFFWDLVGSIQIGENGLAYVVNRKGDLLACKDISRVLKGENLIELEKVSEFVNSTSFIVKNNAKATKGINGNTVVSTYFPLIDPDWAVVVELPILEAYSSVFGAIIFSIIITLLSFVFSVFIGRDLAKRITKPIISLRDATEKISKGNLDTSIDVNSQNELGDLANNFNLMVQRIGELIANTKKAVRVISEQSSILEKSSIQSAENMSAIAVSIQQISQGSFEQSAETEKSSDLANGLAKMIDKAVNKFNDIEVVTKSTKEISANSKDAVQILLQRAQETDEITKKISANSKELNISMEKIRSITDAITGITEQTSLLALNASIEAARAGEAGRGFAVVASETGKLAKKSQDAAKMISTILGEIHTLSSANVKTTEEAHQVVSDQMEAVETVKNSFNEIGNAMDTIIENNAQMIELINNINEFKEQTVRSIMNISTVSEESAASSQEVLAISEEQKVFSEQVKDLAKELHDLSDSLVEITNIFVVRE